jgi:hypothetical protein
MKMPNGAQLLESCRKSSISASSRVFTHAQAYVHTVSISSVLSYTVALYPHISMRLVLPHSDSFWWPGILISDVEACTHVARMHVSTEMHTDNLLALYYEFNLFSASLECRIAYFNKGEDIII